MIRKILIRKNNGSITALLIGQLFVFVLLIWCLYNFRLVMLNAAFNYIDDSLTTSLLGAALVNVEEYGKTNQLIIHNSDTYEYSTSNKDNNGWSNIEADILVSELNYNSDITLNKTNLEYKEVLNYDTRGRHTKNIEENYSTDWYTDYYLRRGLSAFIGNINYNMSNGAGKGNFNVDNIISSVQSLTTSSDANGVKSGPLVVSRDVLGDSFLGTYIDGDIEVTRFELYNLYRATLAERHVYHSKYMLYDGNSVPDPYCTTVTWNPQEPTTDTQFENKYLPTMYLLKDNVIRTINSAPKEADYKLSNGAKIENENYSEEMENYLRDLARWEKDIKFWNDNKGKPTMFCYTDTRTTFLGEYDPNRVSYKHYFSQNNNFEASEWDYSTSSAKEVTVGEKAPIIGYSTFTYDPLNGSLFNAGGNGYKHHVIKPGSTIDPIKIPSGKMAGTEIENTSIYVELTFKVKTFPVMTGLGLNTNMGNSQEVTVARLIDIDINN